MASGNDWIKNRAKTAGRPDREARFQIAGRALGEARRRNREAPAPNPAGDFGDGGTAELGEVSGADTGGSGCPILVEGKKDVVALRKLGFSGVIEKVNRGWNMPRLVAHLYEQYGTRNPIDGGAAIILLMDWDRTGGRLQTALRNRLQALDVPIDENLRNVLMKAMKPEGRTVESLAPFASSLMPLILARLKEE